MCTLSLISDISFCIEVIVFPYLYKWEIPSALYELVLPLEPAMVTEKTGISKCFYNVNILCRGSPANPRPP